MVCFTSSFLGTEPCKDHEVSISSLNNPAIAGIRVWVVLVLVEAVRLGSSPRRNLGRLTAKSGLGGSPAPQLSNSPWPSPHLHYDSYRNQLHAKSELTRPRKAALEALKASTTLQGPSRALRAFSGLPTPRVFPIQANKNTPNLQNVCKAVASNLQFVPFVALSCGGRCHWIRKSTSSIL